MRNGTRAHTHAHKRPSNAVGIRIRKGTEKGTQAEWTESTGKRHGRHKRNVNKVTEAQVPWLVKKIEQGVKNRDQGTR